MSKIIEPVDTNLQIDEKKKLKISTFSGVTVVT